MTETQVQTLEYRVPNHTADQPKTAEIQEARNDLADWLGWE